MKAKSIDALMAKSAIFLFTLSIVGFCAAGRVTFGECAIVIALLLILNELADICRVISYK